MLAASTDASGCVAQSLGRYQSLGQCIVLPGVMVYSNFSFSASGTSASGTPAPTLLTAADIQVTPISGGLGGGFTFGATNNDNLFSVLAGQTATYMIDYDFFIDPGPVMENDDLSLDPPFGNISVSQAFCNDGYFTGVTNANGVPICTTISPTRIPTSAVNENNLFLAQVISVSNSNPPGSDRGHIDFNPPAFFRGQIETTIFLDGGTTGANFGSITSVQGVSDTPEPSSWVLMVGGIVGLGAIGKRSRKV